MERDLVQEHFSGGTGNACSPTGSLCNSWCRIEEAAFLLALYIFGENFVAIARFIVTKGMDDIKSYYYGKFNMSEPHKRWMETQTKKHRKRSFYGKKIFSGWRLPVFVERLLPRLPEELRKNFIAVSKGFGRRRFSVQSYIFFLRPIVRLEDLIEAVGIGSGERDLTRRDAEPANANELNHRVIFYYGRSCFKRTSEDILNSFYGDKNIISLYLGALFWDTVWPRLLANGWHAEKYANSTKTVFLFPGVTSFSETEQTKGTHYFTSKARVIMKLRSDPKLLDIKVTQEEGTSSQANASTSSAEVTEKVCEFGRLDFQPGLIDLNLPPQPE